jgi:hypothetical protein
VLTLTLSMVLSVCGDGRIDTRPEPSCPPCMPGGACQCVTVEVPVEACDGSALGSQTCVGLGFLGGPLKCTRTCQLDTSKCTRTSAPGREVTAGAFGDVAIGETQVAAVTSTRRVLTLEVFDTPSLKPGLRAQLPLRVKGDGAGGVGELRAHAVPSGWVVAGQVYGSASVLTVWHVSPDGTWDERGRAPGQRPLFLVAAGDGLALGGETWAADSKSVGVTVTSLAADGTPGASRAFAAPDRRFTGNSASAAFFGGAVHVLSTCNPNQPRSPVRLDGQPLDQFGAFGALTAEGPDGGQAVIVHEGVWRLRLDATGKPTDAPRRVSEALGPILSAAVRDEGTLEAWFKRGGVLTRLRVPRAGEAQTEDLVSGRNFEVLAVRQAGKATVTLTVSDGVATLHRF